MKLISNKFKLKKFLNVFFLWNCHPQSIVTSSLSLLWILISSFNIKKKTFLSLLTLSLWLLCAIVCHSDLFSSQWTMKMGLKKCLILLKFHNSSFLFTFCSLPSFLPFSRSSLFCGMFYCFLWPRSLSVNKTELVVWSALQLGFLL